MDPAGIDAMPIDTTVADRAVADALAQALVDARLAACVQVVPGVRSTYRWQGAVTTDDEVQLVIETTAGRFDAVDALLRERHPYDLHEVVAVPVVRASAAYLAWVAVETGAAA